MKKTAIGILAMAGIAIAAYLMWGRTTKSPKEITPSPVASPAVSASPSLKEPIHRTIRTKDIAGRAQTFDFSAAIPADWALQAIPNIEALNIYDPSAAGANNLEKSQIFIRYFRANQFLTLSTVTILERREHEIIGRPAVTYVIEKKPGVPNFPNQPAWRNQKHQVTDIRVSDQNPSVFYVFAKRPELPDETTARSGGADDGALATEDVFEKFLESLNLNPENTTLFYPIENFLTGITKKPFGIFITPDDATARSGGADDGALATEDSPVQPERFRGYHTGVDVEIPDAIGSPDPPEASVPVPIFAVADGRVVISQTASGYGGVLAIRHTIKDENILAIYGHLNPDSMPKTGVAVEASQQIGTLGKGFSAETDFERKHLHFGLYRGSDTNINGYVSDKNELSRWHDPLNFFKKLKYKNN